MVEGDDDEERGTTDPTRDSDTSDEERGKTDSTRDSDTSDGSSLGKPEINISESDTVEGIPSPSPVTNGGRVPAEKGEGEAEEGNGQKENVVNEDQLERKIIYLRSGNSFSNGFFSGVAFTVAVFLGIYFFKFRKGSGSSKVRTM